jgi:MFS family permease
MNMPQPLPTFEQYDTLKNKTFVGLLIAEFLAAFNDQCIHASAMFFAIKRETLRESVAITLMPLLFYLPWALFAPLAGYFADRYSKRTSLIFWKVAEIGITGVALLGFFLGARFGGIAGAIGPWLVMSAVFLMGTHSTFYVPNKYGVLPEIFTVRVLSRANGLIESTTFLAVILGTTTGGVFSYLFKDQEYFIGLTLVALALIGTVTSYFIRRMPAANPNLPFPGWLPWHMFRPILKNVVVLARSRLASVSILGLAFYVFMLVYMRQTMYMFGESRNPRWTEQDISLVVAVVSLGVGLGSPLAGYISGGKVELGLVPVGALGIIFGLTLASLSIFFLPIMLVGIVLIGLFSAFYLVPLYSLLQYSAPKGSKGQSVATNNFVCTLGSVSATLVFFLIVVSAQRAGLAQPFALTDAGAGVLTELQGTRQHPTAVEIRFSGNIGRPLLQWQHEDEEGTWLDKTLQALLPSILGKEATMVIRVDERVNLNDEVAVSKYTLRGIDYYHVRPAEAEPPLIYNNEQVPRFLFLGAAALMLVILILLRLRLPDFFLRAYIFVRSLARPIPRAVGAERVPFRDAILVMDCATMAESLPVLAGIVRPIRLVLPQREATAGGAPLLHFLAQQAGTIFLPDNLTPEQLQQIAGQVDGYVRKGYLLAISQAVAAGHAEELVAGLLKAEERPLPVIPVHCPLAAGRRASEPVQVGEPLATGAGPEELRRLLKGGGHPPPVSV